MSFSDALASADRSIRQALGETEPVTYSPSDGDPVEVDGIFDAAYVNVEAGQAGVSSSGPVVWLGLDDLPSDPSTDYDATVTVAGTEYKIREAMPDGKGSVRIFLHLA